MIRKILYPKKDLLSPENQTADFVELFFDLVFVYAITKITAMTAHHLDLKHVFQSLLVFWMIWWGWTQYSWALNSANTKVPEIRMTVLIATSIAFVMATYTGHAFTSQVMWFAMPYILIRLIGITLYIRATSSAEGGIHAGLKAFSSISMLTLVAVFMGAMADPHVRVWWWVAAVALDFLAGFAGGSKGGWDLNAEHFAERHGLILIIALGESLIVAAAAISSQDQSMDILINGALTVVITCMLWWSYFSWIHEHLEIKLEEKGEKEKGTAARDAFSFMHYAILCGIIGLAIGFEKLLAHPHDHLTLAVTASLGVGYALYLGFTALAVWRVSKLILWPRIIILTIASVGIVFTVGQHPHWALSIIAISLLFLITLEWKKCKHSHG